jgi:hypothetical protein
MNIVVQQSGGAKEVQNSRHTTQAYNQVMPTQQQEKDVQQRTTVQLSEDSNRTQLDKEPSEKRKRRRHLKSTQKKTASRENSGSGNAGYLLNTVA